MKKVLEYLNNHIRKNTNLTTNDLLNYYGAFVDQLISIHDGKEKNIRFKTNGNETTFKDAPNVFFVEIFNKVLRKKDHDNESLRKFIFINNNLFQSRVIPYKDSISIYKGLKQVFHNLDSSFFDIASFKELEEFSRIRLELFYRSLRIDSLNLIFPLDYRIRRYNHHLGNYVKILLSERCFVECVDYLIFLFKTAIKEIKQGLIIALVRINDIFTIVSKPEIYNLYIEYGDDIEEDKREWLEILMWFYPLKSEIIYYDSNYKNYQDIGLLIKENFAEVNRHSFGFNRNSTDNSKPEFDNSKIVYTVIDFCIPLEILVGSIDMGKTKIHFQRTDNFIHHPFYRKLTEVFISGNTLGHLLDIEVNDEFTLVKIVFQESYHPEFDFVSSSKIENKDFGEEKALYGRIHLPTKLRIVKMLRKLYQDGRLKGEFELKELNIDLFSFFQVSLITSEQKLLLQRNYFHTSNKKFEYSTYKFYKKLNNLRGFPNDFIDKFNNLRINTHTNLLDCITFLFHSVIEHNIRYKSGYKNFWRDLLCETEPKTEPEVQPYLLNLIESLCTLKGIGVVREPASGEGFIDMLFYYTTSKGRLLKICVEVKKAHHSDVERAINNQFKIYLDSQQTVFGIYLVLWFKYNEKTKFNKPSKFHNIPEIQSAIESNKPIDYEIKTIILDCTKPLSPSKL